MKQSYSFLLMMCMLAMMACSPEDDFITDSGASLEFSTDSLHFDTVFTTIGSATRSFKVFNPHSQSISISKIYLKEGSSSFFRINVDGFPGDEVNDIEIRGKDSLYVFAEVTVNPDSDISSSPFVINEELVFETNGNAQNIVLEAWGQNANYFPDQFSADSLTVLGCNNGEEYWNDSKPYVIYGVLGFQDCTLRIAAGTQVYFHGGLAPSFNADSIKTFYNDGLLLMLDNGTLICEGTPEDPVVFQGDRLEPFFDDIAGQWAGVRFLAGSTGNKLDWTIIKNSIVGLRVDSSASLTLKNSKIFNTSSSSLIGVHANIDMDNCLIHSSGGNCVQIEYGGDYNFRHCTIASYGVDASALRLSNALCYDSFCSDFDVNALNADFENSIIFGSREDEINLFNLSSSLNEFNYSFKNCIVRVTDLTEEESFPNFFDFCNPCINGTTSDALFEDPSDDDYHLDSLSIAEGQAAPLSGLEVDLDNEPRDGTAPDIGCYEYLYE